MSDRAINYADLTDRQKRALPYRAFREGADRQRSEPTHIIDG
jgi:hypothetical protein